MLRSHFFFFNDTATTEIYTLSLHDALPICCRGSWIERVFPAEQGRWHLRRSGGASGGATGSLEDRKSTRLNSSHVRISYAVFCLKKKKGHRLGPPHLVPTPLTAWMPAVPDV